MTNLDCHIQVLINALFWVYLHTGIEEKLKPSPEIIDELKVDNVIVILVLGAAVTCIFVSATRPLLTATISGQVQKRRSHPHRV